MTPSVYCLSASNFQICSLRVEQSEAIVRHFMELPEEERKLRLTHHDQQAVRFYVSRIQFDQNDKELIFGALAKEELAGLVHICFSPINSSGKKLAEINLSVNNVCHRIGIAKALLNLSISKATEAQFDALAIMCDAQDTLITEIARARGVIMNPNQYYPSQLVGLIPLH